MVKWLLSKFGSGDEDLERFIKELTLQKIEYKIVQYVPFQRDEYDIFNVKDCIVCYGSVNWINQIKNKGWIPNIWADEKALECTTYYTYYGKYLINQDYILLPFAEFERRREEWQSSLNDVSIFIRPNSNMKTFNARVLTYNQQLEEYCYDSIDPNTLVVIASHKHIFAEYRFIIVDRKVITGSLYRKNGEFEPSTEIDPKASDLAQEIANAEWSPSSVFVVDIAKTLDGYGLVEIGVFNCAGLYKCDRSLIVKAINKIALKEHEEYYRDI